MKLRHVWKNIFNLRQIWQRWNFPFGVELKDLLDQKSKQEGRSFSSSRFLSSWKQSWLILSRDVRVLDEFVKHAVNLMQRLMFPLKCDDEKVFNTKDKSERKIYFHEF